MPKHAPSSSRFHAAGKSQGQHQTHLSTQIKQVIAFGVLLKKSLWEHHSLALLSRFQPEIYPGRSPAPSKLKTQLHTPVPSLEFFINVPTISTLSVLNNPCGLAPVSALLGCALVSPARDSLVNSLPGSILQPVEDRASGFHHFWVGALSSAGGGEAGKRSARSLLRLQTWGRS